MEFEVAEAADFSFSKTSRAGANLLLARRTGHWRAGARKELLARLREKEGDAREAEKQDRTSQEFDCVFSRPAYEEFQVIYETARASPNPKRPRGGCV